MSTQEQNAASHKGTGPTSDIQPGEGQAAKSVGLGHPGDALPGATTTTTTMTATVTPYVPTNTTIDDDVDNHLPPTHVHVSGVELTLGGFALLSWFVVFAGGILIPTEPYRELLAKGNESLPLLGSAVLVLMFWTVTNVGILCCISAFLGALGRRTRFAVKAQAGPSDGYVDLWPAPPAPMAAHYASAVIRGFMIYGIVMAGLLVLATETFTNTTQGGYFRLASTVSVLSFYAGYDPELFAGVLDRVKTLLGPPAGKAG
jgi:hypothetical protein